MYVNMVNTNSHNFGVTQNHNQTKSMSKQKFLPATEVVSRSVAYRIEETTAGN